MKPSHRCKRTNIAREANAFSPSGDWLLSFDAQYRAPELRGRLARFARRRAGIVASTGYPVDDYFVEELVQDVVADTLAGVLEWDHAEVSLEKHVMDAIKSRTRHLYVHNTTFKHERLDDLNGRGRAEHERVLSEQADEVAEREAAWLHASETLRALGEATDDIEVLQLVDAFENGICRQADVLEHTGLTREQFRAARKRMRTLVEQLPRALRHRDVP